MTDAAALASGKGHNDENFPVASFIIAKQHRPAIFAFYDFVRAADDVSDNPDAAPEEKLAILETMRATLMGESDISPEGVKLRKILAQHKLSPEHALDLLEAFRRDVTKLRYTDWDDLIGYCRYSAMPVGRYVLDVHGESKDLWPANDALCAALQVINHLQDCSKDYRDLNRVYLPQDVMTRYGVHVEDLAKTKATAGLKAAIADTAGRNAELLRRAVPFAGQIKDSRLSLEVVVIQRLAEDLNIRLFERDPLSQRVHHKKWELPALLVSAGLRFAGNRIAAKRRA